MSPSVTPEVQAALYAQTAVDLLENTPADGLSTATALHMLRRIADLLPVVPNINRTALTPTPPPPDQPDEGVSR